MCGFAGVVHWNQTPVVRDELARMGRLVCHRGPDELHVELAQEHVGFVHARLCVIDLSSTARQPMGNEQGTVWLAYNGEVYNYRALRATLETLGHRFRGQSDTEVVLRAYEAWGTDAIHQLDGMFALALWDRRTQTLLLARDRAGKKPLFYWTNGQCVAFGSEIKGVLAHQHVPCAMDETAIPFLLAFGYPPTGQTCYRDVYQVPAASYLTMQAGRPAHTQRYWQLDFTPTRRDLQLTDASQALRPLVTDAVRKRLVSDVPLGAFLSGGIDSTIIVGEMSKLLPGQRVKTFSMSFEGDKRFDETAYATCAAEFFGSDHTVFRATPQSFDLLERLVWHHDQPFGDSSAIPMYLLAQRAREHVTVALTGEGGDELFGGYRRFVAALWADRVPTRMLMGADRLLRDVPARTERSVLAWMKRLVAVARFPMPERYMRWSSYWSALPLKDGQATRHAEGYVSRLHPSMSSWWDESAPWSLLSRILYLNYKEYLANDLLVKVDRCSMAHGLELRCPFLDTALVEYTASLPDHMKIRGAQTKVVLKRACRDLLPRQIARRKKMGFGVPLGTWFRGQWREPLQDMLGTASSRIYRYVDAAAVQRVMQDHLSGRIDAGHRLWLLLTFEVWLRQMEETSATVTRHDAPV